MRFCCVCVCVVCVCAYCNCCWLTELAALKPKLASYDEYLELSKHFVMVNLGVRTLCVCVSVCVSVCICAPPSLSLSLTHTHTHTINTVSPRCNRMTMSLQIQCTPRTARTFHASFLPVRGGVRWLLRGGGGRERETPRCVALHTLSVHSLHFCRPFLILDALQTRAAQLWRTFTTSLAAQSTSTTTATPRLLSRPCVPP